MATSIFQVQVDDEAFKKFQQDFEKYTVSVEGLPMAWGRIEQAIKGVGERIDAQTDALSAVITATDKATDRQKAYNRALRDTAGAWGNISRWTRMAVQDAHRLLGIYGAISSRLSNAAVSMLKWGTVGALGAGLAGAGGLWGISNLASAAGATRRASQGMGLRPGELRAFETNYSKMFDARSVLGNLSSIRNDPDRRWALISMGLNPNDSTGDLARQAPLRAKQIYEEGGQSLAYARARGLLEVFTEEDLQRLHSMTVQEIEASRQMVEQDRRRMQVSDALSRRWQALGTQFERASNVIQTVFLDALSPLAPEIEKLSDAFTEAVKTAMSMEGMRTAITGLATGIRAAGGYISSNEFLEDIRKFGAAVESVWRAISRVAAWINSFSWGGATEEMGAGPAGVPYTRPAGAPDIPDSRIGGFDDPVERERRRRARYWGVPDADRLGRRIGTEGYDPVSAAEVYHRLPEGLLDAIWQRESARGRRMGPSSAGARGHFQFMPETGREYGLQVDPRTGRDDFLDLGKSSAAAGAFVTDLLVRFRGDLAKAVAGYNWGAAYVERAVRDHGENWRNDPRLPQETRAYLAAVVDPLIERLRRQDQERGGRQGPAQPPRVDLRIENPAGAQVAVTGAAARAQ